MQKLMEKFITIKVRAYPESACECLRNFYKDCNEEFKVPRLVTLRTDYISEIFPIRDDGKEDTAIVMSNGDVYISADNILK